MSYIFFINKQEVNVTVNPPSRFYRTQFGALMGQWFGHDGKNVNVSDTVFYELDEEQLKALLKCTTTLTFEQKNAIDLSYKDNYKNAMGAVADFFFQLRKTTID